MASVAFPVGRDEEYAVSLYFGGEQKDRISLRFYDPSNALFPSEGRLTLSSIRSGNAGYQNLVVRNVLGKKELLVSGTSVGVATVEFARGGSLFDFELHK